MHFIHIAKQGKDELNVGGLCMGVSSKEGIGPTVHLPRKEKAANPFDHKALQPYIVGDGMHRRVDASRAKFPGFNQLPVYNR